MKITIKKLVLGIFISLYIENVYLFVINFFFNLIFFKLFFIIFFHLPKFFQFFRILICPIYFYFFIFQRNFSNFFLSPFFHYSIFSKVIFRFLIFILFTVGIISTYCYFLNFWFLLPSQYRSLLEIKTSPNKKSLFYWKDILKWERKNLKLLN